MRCKFDGNLRDVILTADTAEATFLTAEHRIVILYALADSQVTVAARDAQVVSMQRTGACAMRLQWDAAVGGHVVSSRSPFLRRQEPSDLDCSKKRARKQKTPGPCFRSGDEIFRALCVLKPPTNTPQKT